MSVAELAEHFALTGVHRSNAVVDRRRLDWMQGRHVRRALQAACGACTVNDEQLCLSSLRVACRSSHGTQLYARHLLLRPLAVLHAMLRFNDRRSKGGVGAQRRW